MKNKSAQRERERERQRDRQTERQTDRQTENTFGPTWFSRQLKVRKFKAVHYVRAATDQWKHPYTLPAVTSHEQ